MTKRPEALREMALKTGETLVTVDNYSRAMAAPEVPAPFNTTLGRGHRHARLKVEWLCSTFLAMTLADPKNAAWQVPACGNMLIGTSLFVQKHTKVEGNALNLRARKSEESIEFPASFNDPWHDLTFFQVFVGHVKELAVNWNGPLHQLMRAGFTMTIVLGKSMWAELDEVVEVDYKDGSTSSCRTPFFAPDEKVEVSAVTPLRRKVEILLPHIEMLALLYADTLKHEGELPPSTPSETAPAPADAGAETENAGSLPGEPAPSDCQPFAHATNRSTHTQTSGLDYRRNKPGVCVESSGKRVKADSVTSNRRQHHVLEPHHHASA